MARIERRALQAEMATKYCQGVPRRTEALFGWSRGAVALGLPETRTGVVCRSAQSALSGKPLWENKSPQVVVVLWEVAHAQQDPSFRGPLSYTRLSAAAALQALRDRGFADAVLPSPRAMANSLNRNGYRLRPVLKAKPEKKFRKPTPSSTTAKPKCYVRLFPSLSRLKNPTVGQDLG